ncbi:MAG: hypothetical protein JRI59_09535 [Deltaproteobacteria bacterium]|nr:hypothetical protein [Deltaproteobacteria bacterium]
MDSSAKAVPQDFSVRLGEDEIGLIFNLKENLDYSDQLARSWAGNPGPCPPRTAPP